MEKNYRLWDSVLLPLKYSPLIAILIAFFDICLGVIPTLQTFAVARFIDSAIKLASKEVKYQQVMLWIMVLIVLIAIMWLSRCIKNLMAARLELNLRKNFRMQITQKRSKLKYFYIEDSSTWDLISRISEKPETRLKNAYVSFLDFLALIVQISGLLILFIMQVWQIAIVMLLIVIPLFVISIKSGKESYNVKLETQKYHRRHEYLADILISRDATQERVTFGYSDGICNMWHQFYEKARKIELRTKAKWFVRSKSGGIVTTCIAVIVSLFLIEPVLEKIITTGMFMSLVNSTYSLVDTMVWSLVTYVELIANNNEYMKEFDKFTKLEEVQEEAENLNSNKIIFESIEFCDVKFKYPGTDKYILNGFSFKFENGLNYALVGGNGAGKTTLVKILTCLYDNYEGTILLNGINIKEYNSEDIKKIFTTVFQDYAKYSLSIKDNIKIGHLEEYNELDDEKIEKIVKRVGLDTKLYQNKEGLETKLGKIYKDGQDISGGQWQKIALARAVVHDAQLCIFDEPTAALDPISESNLYNEFFNISKGRTIILISHRLGSTKIADKILVLNKGKLFEEGTHQQLVEANGIYANMYESQRSWYGEV